MPTTQNITKRLVDTGVGLLYNGIAFVFPQSYAQTHFVNKNGDDATGIKGRHDKPFLTISAAIAVAANGDSITVYPGTYNEKLYVSPLTNLTFHLFDAKLTWDAATADPALYISTTKLSIYAFGSSSIIRTNQTSGYAVECAGNATANFRYLTITGNQAGFSNGVLAGGELFNCKVTAGNGTAVNAIYKGMKIMDCDITGLSGNTSTTVIAQIPLGDTNIFRNCKIQSDATYAIRTNSDGVNLFENCDINNSTNKPLRVESGTKAKFINCKIKGIVYTEIIQAVVYLLFQDREIVATTGNSAVYFYNSPVNDYSVEFNRCKIISPVSATYSLDNAFSANNKINAMNCIANKPFNNIAGVTNNNAIDANLKELV